MGQAGVPQLYLDHLAGAIHFDSSLEMTLLLISQLLVFVAKVPTSMKEKDEQDSP